MSTNKNKMNVSLSEIRKRREKKPSSDTSLDEQLCEKPKTPSEEEQMKTCPYPECNYKTKKRLLFANTPEDRMKSHIHKCHYNDTIQSPSLTKSKITADKKEKLIIAKKNLSRSTSNVAVNRAAKILRATQKNSRITTPALSSKLRRNTMPLVSQRKRRIKAIPLASTSSTRVKRYLITPDSNKKPIVKNEEIERIFGEALKVEHRSRKDLQKKVEELLHKTMIENQNLNKKLSNMQIVIDSKIAELTTSKNMEIAKDVALSNQQIEHQKEIKSLKKSLEAKQSGVEELLKEKTQLTEELRKTVFESNLLQNQLKEHRSEKENSSTLVAKFQNELQASLNVQEYLRNELESSKMSYANETITLQGEIHSLKADLKRQREESPEILKSLVVKSSEYQCILKENEVMKAALKDMKQETIILQEEMHAFKADSKKQKEENPEIAKSLIVNSAEYLSIWKEKEDMKATIKDIKKERQQILNDKENASARCLQYESNYNRIQSILEEKSEECEQLRNASSRLALENRKLSNSISDLRESVIERDLIIGEIEKEKDKAEEKVKTLQVELDASNRKQEDFARKLGLKHYHAKANGIEDDKEVADATKTNEKHSETVASLTEQLENLRRYCYEKERKLETLELEALERLKERNDA